MTRKVILVLLALASAGCEGALAPACDSIGVYRGGHRAGDVYVSESGDFTCNDLTVQYSCKDRGGVLCRFD